MMDCESIPGYDIQRDADGYYFDEKVAQHAVDFFPQYLAHPEGEGIVGTPFELLPWEEAIVANVFGWLDKDTHRRRYRQVFVYVPRKNGKTVLAAGIALYTLFQHGYEGSRIYFAASETDQAGQAYSYARYMVENNEWMDEHVTLWKRAMVFDDNEGNFGSLKVLSSEAGSKHGLNPLVAIIDELHAHKSGDLTEALRTGVASRKQPLVIYLTTADYERSSICNDQHDYACKVRDGIVRDPAFLPVIYEASKQADWTDPDVWARVNPSLGHAVQLEYMRDQCEEAKIRPSYEGTFRRLHLNTRTEQAERWLRMEQWDACSGQTPDLEGKPCFAGLDFGDTEDLTALSLYFPETHDALMWCWVPSETVFLRQRRGHGDYYTWMQEELMLAIEGARIDERKLAADVVKILAKYDVRGMAVDRIYVGAATCRILNEDHGYEPYAHGQGYVSMAAPTRRLEELVVGRELKHGGNPVLRWMAANAIVKIDEAGNKKPDKAKSSEKIDGLVALIMAIGMCQAAEPPTTSVYETEGLMVL